MRVITGTARGRRLRELEGQETRPTTDRVKEGLFNIVQFAVEGRRVLDLFAGTGQLGIEALSRGAKSAVFVEQRRDAVQLIRENLKATELEGRVVAGEAMSFLGQTREKFDLIFLDPPYGTGLLERALKEICRLDLLAAGGIIVCESPLAQELPPLAPPYGMHRTYRYGKIKLTTYHREGEQ